tara:strand:- start:424 stop:654 length:231 start_codon:yes stop_codon:yes gene_type:complete
VRAFTASVLETLETMIAGLEGAQDGESYDEEYGDYDEEGNYEEGYEEEYYDEEGEGNWDDSDGYSAATETVQITTS